MNNFAMVSALVGLVTMALAPRGNLRSGRLAYWLGGLVVATSAFFIGYPQGWKSGIGASAFAAVAIVFIAYAYTPFIKLQGKKFSFYTDRTEPYGGGVTIGRSWWRITVAMIVIQSGILTSMATKTNVWVAAVAAAVIPIAGVFFGHRDAVAGRPIASGQHAPFILVSIVSLAIFPIAYLVAYYSSRRWLVRYQAYGRHQSTDHP